MLDGLLGRSGFYSKCKSLLKQTRARIDVLKRKRSATQKFTRKDIADLLANGLENNAFARAEALIKDLLLSSCYDFIDYLCEYILKQLSVLHKNRECPEDCREAVASLMYAAAWFSDLPELRELRDLFQERYGSSLEFYVNQKLVENVTSKPPSMEKKVQLMQEIASEFSVWWDRRAFEERISKPSAGIKNQRQSPGTVHAAAVRTTIRDELLAKNRSDAYRYRERDVADLHQMAKVREGINGRRQHLKHNELSESDNQRRSLMKKREEDVLNRSKSDFRNALPPPYVKSRRSEHKSNISSKHANYSAYANEKDLNSVSKSDRSDGVTSADNEVGLGRLTEIYYKDASSSEFAPRRRSHRRKHSRSKSIQDTKVSNGREDETQFRRVSTSRRKHESRKGLQVVYDDYKKEKEEKMIDKLLLHYSRKPSSVDPVKPNPKTNTELKDLSKSPHHKPSREPKLDEVVTPMTSRSMSFPPRQVAVPEQEKVFARASSFQQHSSPPAKHVHPKLPDYDDLAARFGALKVCKW